ncbi:twin-arginine translocation signal domain-containing protein [Haladaptatus sp. GCM10025707]|uniref:twin-arginine translocation signal domain-containing protein n=1 Tax=unclassified Haladaptatus TaxID=2622732 RepID=UPI0023E833DC|nr:MULTISPECIES: twin-arginine translocation signal domain-containing protein [unclassified Haladaptatus]
MASRRNFLKAGGATFALASIGSLAGCTQLEDIGGNAGGPPSYSTWLYDPEAVLNVDNHLFASLNVQSFYENEEQLPPELFEGLEELDNEIDSVDVKAMKHVTAIGYAETDFSRGGMSMVVSGKFNGKAIVDEIEAEMENSGEELSKSTYEGYTLYSYETPYGYGMSGESEAVMSGTLAVGDENLLLGMLLDADVRAETTIKQMVQSDAGDVERYYDANDNARTLMMELGDATMAIGLNLEVSLLKDWVPDEEKEIKAVLDDLEAMGWGATINGETTENKIVLVYDEEEAASAENVEALIERMKEESEEFEENTAEITVSKDGRAVVVTTDVDTKSLWEDLEETDGGFMGGSGGSYVDGSSGSDVEVPAVSFSFEQNTDGTVTVTHQGGDHVTDVLYLEYVDDEGYDQFEFWMPSGSAIKAGDSHTTKYAVNAGTELTVLWTGPQGSSFETLGTFRAN